MKSFLIFTLLSVTGVTLGEDNDKELEVPEDFLLPYMVYLQSSPEPCAGSLIHPEWVLTAAHCSLPTKILLGIYQTNRNHKQEQIRNYSLALPHPEFDAQSLKNDLMLIKLSKPSVLNKYVGTIAIALERMKSNESCFIPTWTWNKYKSFSDPDKLTWINQYSLPSHDCRNILQQQEQGIMTNIMCIGHPLDAISKITEVSAAPAICYGRVYGILSWAKEGVTLGNEGFYTEVYPYAKWIMQMISSY